MLPRRPGKRLAGLAWLALIVASAAPAQSDRGDVAAEKTRFARVDVTDAGDPRALQTAIVTYASPDAGNGPTVDLIAAVHVGDAGYYAELNARFRAYDALLYEMVAPVGASVPSPGANRTGLVTNAQLAMRSVLALDYQLDEIDYTAANFVHADLSPDELRDRMRARNESLYVYFWRAFYASVRQATRDPLGLTELGLLSTLVASPDGLSLKASMAYQLADVDDVSSIIDGPDGSALIAERNQRAIEVLTASISAGSGTVGIFYGAAHMPDLERRLVSQLDLVPVRVRWVDAWRLSDDPPEMLR